VLVTYLNEVDAFWVMVSLLKGFNLRGLFLQNLPLLKHYLYRFYFLVASYMPALSRHFDEQGIKPLYYSAEWFSTLFSYNMNFELTSRIWDVLLFEGPEYLFRIGLAILKISEGDLLRLNFDEIMMYLKSKTSELDLNVLTEADKFIGLTQMIANIDSKFESVQEKVLAESTVENSTSTTKRDSYPPQLIPEKKNTELNRKKRQRMVVVIMGRRVSEIRDQMR